MAMVWIECKDEDALTRTHVFALIGAFNNLHPMPAERSPICALSIDVDFGDHPVDIHYLRHLPGVVAADLCPWRKLRDPQEVISELFEILLRDGINFIPY